MPSFSKHKVAPQECAPPKSTDSTISSIVICNAKRVQSCDNIEGKRQSGRHQSDAINRKGLSKGIN